MLTMWPLPVSHISARASCVMWKKPAMLVAHEPRAKSASVYSVKGLAMKMPALLTSVSIRPKRDTPSAIDRSAVSRSADVAGDDENVGVIRCLDGA